MQPGPALRPDVFPTGDGERSSAGSNDGDWRPAQPPAPHGYDFEKRFVPPALDPDFKPLRDEPERDLDALTRTGSTPATRQAQPASAEHPDWSTRCPPGG
jgi:hypothetical protein